MPFLNKAVLQRSFGPTVLSNRPVVRLVAEPLSVEQRAAIVAGWDRAVAALGDAFADLGLDGPHVAALAEPSPASELVHEALAGLVARCAVCLMAAASCPWPAGNASPSDDGRILAYWNDWMTGVGLAAGRQSVRLVETALAAPASVQSIVGDALKAVFDARFDPFYAAMVRAVEKRSIPWRLAGPGSPIVSYGQGARQQWFQGTMSNRQSRVCVHLTMRKHLSVALLRAAGLPVPEHGVAQNREGALLIARQLGFPLVVKPDTGSRAQNIFLNLMTEHDVLRAFDVCQQVANRVLVERFYPGIPYRVTVCNGRAIAAARHAMPFVIGDGRSTVQALIEDQAAQRHRVVEDHYRLPLPLKTAGIADDMAKALRDQHLALDRVPPEGFRVFLSSLPSLQIGGIHENLTDRVHPSTMAMAEEVARILHSGNLGVDFITTDFSRPHEEVPLVINEVNAAASLRTHIVTSGPPRDISEELISPFFPDGDQGRIPIAATFGATETGCLRIAERVLTERGERVGFADTKAAEIEGYRLRPIEGEAAHPGCALLRDKRPTLAVMAVQPYDALVRGLPSDRLDVIALMPELFGSLDNAASRRAARAAVGLPGTALVLPIEAAAVWPMGESPHRQAIFVTTTTDLAAPPEGWVVAVEDGEAETQLAVYRNGSKDPLGRLGADRVAQDAAQEYAWAAALVLGLGIEPLAIARQVTALALRPPAKLHAGGEPA